MKTIVHVTLTDEQRQQLASLIDNKPTKRMATRADVTAFVEGGMQRVLADTAPAANPSLTTGPARVVSGSDYDVERDPKYVAARDAYVAAGNNNVKGFEAGWRNPSFANLGLPV